MFRRIALINIIFYLTFFFTGFASSEEEYYLTLRNSKVNLRQGPSFDYSVKLTYEKKFLPVFMKITLAGYTLLSYQKKKQQ